MRIRTYIFLFVFAPISKLTWIWMSFVTNFFRMFILTSILTGSLINICILTTVLEALIVFFLDYFSWPGYLPRILLQAGSNWRMAVGSKMKACQESVSDPTDLLFSLKNLPILTICDDSCTLGWLIICNMSGFI